MKVSIVLINFIQKKLSNVNFNKNDTECLTSKNMDLDEDVKINFSCEAEIMNEVKRLRLENMQYKQNIDMKEKVSINKHEIYLYQ